MTTKPGANQHVVAAQHEGEIETDWLYLDALPQRIRLTLVEALYEYPAEQVFQAYKGALFHSLGSERRAQDEVIHMIHENDMVLRHQDRQQLLAIHAQMVHDGSYKRMNTLAKYS